MALSTHYGFSPQEIADMTPRQQLMYLRGIEEQNQTSPSKPKTAPMHTPQEPRPRIPGDPTIARNRLRQMRNQGII